MTFYNTPSNDQNQKSTESTINKEANDCGITDQKNPTPTNGRNYLNVSSFTKLINSSVNHKYNTCNQRIFHFGWLLE